MDWQKRDDFRHKQTKEFLNTNLHLQSIDKGILYYKNNNVKCWVSEDVIGDYCFELEESVINLLYCSYCKFVIDGKAVLVVG